MSKQEKDKKQPEMEIRYGRIKATIWGNETENGIRHNVTITRLYKDGDSWKDTTHFNRDDLPLVAKVADEAHTWIYRNSNDNDKKS